MSQQSKPTEKDLVNYCDFSSKEDEKLCLISNLLLQTEGEIEAKDARRIGEMIQDCVETKRVLAHYFLGRSVSNLGLSEKEIKAEIKKIETLVE